MINKPIKNYPGSKSGSGVWQRIISLMPKHDIYIEPFLGSGSILTLKDAARINLGFDISADIINKYDAGHGFFFSAVDTIKFLDSSAPLVNAVHLSGNPILIYCDPPFPFESRKSKAKLYKHEFSLVDHKIFLDTISILKCFVMISTYDNEMYQNSLSSWNRININTVTRSGPSIETVYYNFSDTIPKHQYNFMGENFRDRAAIKGRILRNASKLLSMPAAERNMILQMVSKNI